MKELNLVQASGFLPDFLCGLTAKRVGMRPRPVFKLWERQGVVNRPPLLFAFQTPAAPAAGPSQLRVAWELGEDFPSPPFTAALLTAVNLPKVLPVMEAQKRPPTRFNPASQRSKNREIVPNFSAK